MNKIFFILAGFLMVFALLYYFNPTRAEHQATMVKSVAGELPSTKAFNTQLFDSAQQVYDTKLQEISKSFLAGRLTVAQAAQQRDKAKAEFDAARAAVASLPSPAPPAASAPAPDPFPRLYTPPHSITLLAPNKWHIVLPADEELHTGIKVKAGQTITYSDWAGTVKLNPPETFVNHPAGSFPTQGLTLAKPEPFTFPSAWVGALISRLATDREYSDVGGRMGSSFKVEGGDGEILLSVNTLLYERSTASGSYEVTIVIQ